MVNIGSKKIGSNQLQLSYAQNGEDIVLDRVFKNISNGFYIDIGAYHPTEDSVTKLFLNKGWKGINIEPIPQNFSKFVEERKTDINLNIGIAEKKSVLTFYECTTPLGWSTFSEKVMKKHTNSGKKYTKYQIEVITLNQLFDKYIKRKEVQFLKIDAEGFESKIIKGNNWSLNRPIVLVIEKNDYSQWEHILLNNQYVFALDDGINRFYLRQENKDMLSKLNVSANITDAYIKYSIYSQLEEQKIYIKKLSAEINNKNKYIEGLSKKNA